MALKIKDVANLLNVSETTIRRWVSEKKIPYYKMSQHCCFDRNEIESWVLSQNTLENKTKSDNKALKTPTRQRGGIKQFSLFRAIHKGIVLLDVPGQTKEELIQTTVKTIAKHLSLDAEVLTELLLDRESLMPTALNNGIGIPHTRDFLLKDHCDVVVVVFPEKAIPYGALDGKPVHSMFFLLACDDKQHLHLLAKIAHFSHNSHALDFLKTKPSKNKLLEYIKSWEGNIHQVTDDHDA